MLRPGDVIALTIEKPVPGGRMLARHEGQVVLVSGTLPGEDVRARVERVARGVAMAATMEVIAAHADRRPVVGNPACGGQVYAHVNYSRQLAIKAAVIEDAFSRIARMALPADVDVAASAEQGYRMRSRLHVRGGEVGFFLEGTHTLCDAAATGQLLPGAIEAARAVVRDWPWRQAGRIIAVEISENMAGDERALHLELEQGNLATRMPGLRIDGVRGVSAGATSEARARVVFGDPYVSDAVGALLASAAVPEDARLRRHAHAFFQGNRYLLRALIARVLALVEAGPILDLYAGVGLFAVALAASGRDRIMAIEIDPTAAEDLAANASAFRSVLRIVHDRVERVLADRPFDGAATVIVDPPRTGMSREALDGVLACGATSIVYVSCDVATLARDARRLVDAGYRLEQLEAFDLFPNTAHVEALATFRRLD